MLVISDFSSSFHFKKESSKFFNQLIKRMGLKIYRFYEIFFS
jgi:hypothetical protein